MPDLTGAIALVTGASRGIGKGVALSLGEAGATVYLTGRTEAADQATVPLAGTIHETAAAVTAAGGRGIAVRCDHSDDAQVAALFERIRAEQGRLDVLVNNAWAGYELLHRGGYQDWIAPFWEQPLERWDGMFAVGVRSHYAAARLAAPLMIAQGRGLIVNVSFKVAGEYGGNVGYGVTKAAADKMAADMAHELRPHGVAAVSLYPGLVRTEGVMLYADYFDLSVSQSPRFVGRAVAALAADPDALSRSGEVLTVDGLAEAYGVADPEPAPAEA
ncbi:MAG TPA: SDR family NAD(P)-dependent oxidoreductase [Herpetosiphonaceae bacterium]